MCSGLIGKKLGMTGFFNSEGRHIPVTVIEVGPCIVTQIKTSAKDGYDALQLGFQEKKASRVSKPLQGHFRKAGEKCFAWTREFSAEKPDDYELGQALNAELFTVGEKVNIAGRSKGRGFSGVIKRHGFHGGRKTHGSHSHRIPGSVGCSAYPAKIIKGKRMPGQYGNEKKTVRNLEIIDVRADENIIMVKGAVPGAASGVISIMKQEAGRPS